MSVRLGSDHSEAYTLHASGSHNFVLGAAGFGLATSHTPDRALQRLTGPSRIELGYGGPRLGYVIASRQVLHLTAAVLVGAGALGISTRDPARDGGYDHHDGAVFFALEPELGAELNVARFMRLVFSASYRYLRDTNKAGLQASDSSGPAGGLAFRFGAF